MRFLLRDSCNNYYCIDFTSEMCTDLWVKTQEQAKCIRFNPTDVGTWPARLLPDIQKVDYLATDYDIIEIDSIPLAKFKQLHPEYFI